MLKCCLLLFSCLGVFVFNALQNKYLCSSSNSESETADWEKELQQELQDYEVVTESDNKDDLWDQEIEKMLQADSS